MDDEKLLHESLSGHSSVYGDSDLNDLQYDQSLIENLFYKTSVSGSFSRFLLDVCYYWPSIHLVMATSINSLISFRCLIWDQVTVRRKAQKRHLQGRSSQGRRCSEGTDLFLHP